MGVFLERIHKLMPVLGTEALVPVGSTPGSGTRKQTLICEIKGVKATGHPIPNGFVVLKGSQAVLKERPSAHQYPYTLTVRRKLIEDRTLVAEGQYYEFTRDVEFSSPSAAATVVHGGSANGLLAWKTPSGKTLKALEGVNKGS